MGWDIQHLFLLNHGLFSQLREPEIKELFAIAEYKRVKKNTVIYSYTQEKDRFYILIQGRVKVAYRIEKNLEVVSEILKEGDIFGELTLKKSANTNCEFAQVLSREAAICSFKLENFEYLLKKNSGFAFAFSQMVANKLKIVSGKYCDVVFKDVRARVLNFFRLHAQYEGRWTGSRAEIKMYCTHQDIANFTASSRQTVSTIINTLVREKKIMYEGRSKLIIPDIRRLEI